MTTTATRTNRYAGTCSDCGGHVPAEQGILIRQDGRWATRHHDDQHVTVTVPDTAAALTEPVTETGMYRRGEDIFKVQRSRQSGNLYAKRLVPIGGQRLVDDTEEVVGFEFAYAPGTVQNLTPADRMTLDEAKAFGLRYGVCCVCGAHLKDATSVAAGIGPVCGGRV
jgi:hypothetical protein